MIIVFEYPGEKFAFKASNYTTYRVNKKNEFTNATLIQSNEPIFSIEKVITRNNHISHYESNGEQLSVDDRNTQYSELLKGAEYVEEVDRMVYTTLEQKQKCEEFSSKWEPVYITDTEYIQQAFTIEKINKSSNKYIEPARSNIFDTNPVSVLSINYYEVADSIAKSFGFTIEPSNSSINYLVNEDLGKKIFRHGHGDLKYCKIAGEYVYLETVKCGTFTGTYEECVAKYDKVFEGMVSIFKHSLAKLNPSPLDPLTIKKVVCELDKVSYILIDAKTHKTLRGAHWDINKARNRIVDLVKELDNIKNG